jgi:ABC-2 type transport system ATP-binding protein
MNLIELRDVKKEFKVYEQQQGFRNVMKSFFKREEKIVHAVNGLSFNIEEGELVGFIGKNGAGKSTTIKMMSGILYPTSGEIFVDGIRPYENRKQNAMNIGVIFGQRARLFWDLPMQDSFELYKEMYRIDRDKFQKNVRELIELFDMGEFLKTPIRQLSFGQRMKVEISVALLHEPKIHTFENIRQRKQAINTFLHRSCLLDFCAIPLGNIPYLFELGYIIGSTLNP